MNSRSSGVLLHPTSLPGNWGIGELGREAYEFVDFLAQAGQNFWQILPLGATGHGNSPYQSFSAFAGNPLLISVEDLVDRGLLSHAELRDAPAVHEFSESRVRYEAVTSFKSWCLNRAFHSFSGGAHPAMEQALEAFSVDEGAWLDDFALFAALKDYHQGTCWNHWERTTMLREPGRLKQWREEVRLDIRRHQFFQYLFFEQWSKLKQYANQRSILIIGDMPIFVAYDGADVWSHPDLFFLDEERRPTGAAGVPPDYFSPTGQLWGNPLYRWDRMAEDGYHWWIRRVRKTLEMVDIVRLDHFRGFEEYWEVPAGKKDAINGRWVKGPGAKFFVALEHAIGQLPFIAEDLGVITPEVELLRDQFHLPGMKVLHFAFGDTSANPYLPHNHVPNCVVYTGTHDNDTTLGWFKSLDSNQRKVVERYLGHAAQDISWDLICLAFATVARTAVVPMQDLLGLDSDSRMNIPGTTEGNWEWRLPPGSLHSGLARRLKTATQFYGRDNGSRVELWKLVTSEE